MKKTKVAIMSPIADTIGEASVVPRLSIALSKLGYDVELIDCQGEWKNLQAQTSRVKIVDLGIKKVFPYIPTFRWLSSWLSYRVWSFVVSLGILIRLPFYLKSSNPDILVVRMLTGPTAFAHMMTGTNSKLIISMGGLPKTSPIRVVLWRKVYKQASAFIAPNKGVAEVASSISKISTERFEIIPNPVIDDSIMEKSLDDVVHPWYVNSNISTILSVGRLTRQKDFSTLITAFKKIKEQGNFRLLILGEGEERRKLETLIEKLDLKDHVQMPGFEKNPYKFMKGANMVVSTSKWEGPGHVIIEAQAIGVPIISTDCPEGPRDTLLDGEAGTLVTVGDSDALASAIMEITENITQQKNMVQAGLGSSSRFTDESVSMNWKKVIDKITER
jgi:glycosyltransferase involved in cell wall biosynthesis